MYVMYVEKKKGAPVQLMQFIKQNERLKQTAVSYRLYLKIYFKQWLNIASQKVFVDILEIVKSGALEDHSAKKTFISS